MMILFVAVIYCKDQEGKNKIFGREEKLNRRKTH